MNDQKTPLILASILAIAVAFSSFGCSDDNGGSETQKPLADAGQQEDATSPSDDGGGDGLDSDATPTDTGDTSDAKVNTPPPPLADGIEIVGVQAFQSVERPLFEDGAAVSSDIPLIAGKETLFRVLVEPQDGWTPQEVTAQVVLSTEEDGVIEVLSDTFRVTGPSLPRYRNTLFEIKAPRGTLTTEMSAHFRLVGDGETTADSTEPSPARWPRDGSAVDLEATDSTGKLHIVLVPIRFDTDGSGRLPDTSLEQVVLFDEAIRAHYPAYDLRLQVHEPIAWTGAPDFGALIRKLRDLKMDEGAEEPYFYGLIRPTDTFSEFCTGSCTTGQGFKVENVDNTSYRVGAGVGYSGEGSAGTMVHELGHMHGRGHAPCGVSGGDRYYPYSGGTIGVWGWDYRTDTLHGPDEATDFMSYCNNRWVSDYTYLGIFKRMQDVNNRQQAMSLGAVRTWRYVNWSDSEEPSWGQLSRERDPTTGQWATARFVDADGEVLQKVQVPLIEYSHQGARSVLVPEAPKGATQLLIEAPSKAFALEMP